MNKTVASTPPSADLAGKVAQLYQKRARIAGEKFAEAAKLMADFYDHLWQQGESPRAALRAAKSAAKARGAAFRDWAGWALSGR